VFTDPAIQSITALMARFPAPWAFCGGWAIDLFVGTTTRTHKDVDIAILRRDQLALQRYLLAAGWAMQIAHEGAFEPWPENQYLALPRHGIWCRNPRCNPDFLEVLLNEADGETFRFRRDQSLTRDLERTFLRTPDDLPYLASEIVLLYKSKDTTRPDTNADFAAALPRLSAEQRVWLAFALERMSPGHPWLRRLSSMG
jgi:hypothetical protein